MLQLIMDVILFLECASIFIQYVVCEKHILTIYTMVVDFYNYNFINKTKTQC